MAVKRSYMGDVAPDRHRNPKAAACAQLKDAFAWFSKAARYNRIAYQVAWISSLVLSAAVTLAAALDSPAAATALLGAAVVVIQGLQRGFRWSDNYYHYRAAAEELRAAAMAFDSHTAPFDGPDAHKQLSSIVQNVVRTEQKAWLELRMADALAQDIVKQKTRQNADSPAVSSTGS